MANTYSLSAGARSLSLAKVMRLSDDDAFDLFRDPLGRRRRPVR